MTKAIKRISAHFTNGHRGLLLSTESQQRLNNT